VVATLSLAGASREDLAWVARREAAMAALARVEDLAYRWSLGNATTKAAAAELRDAISGRI